MKWMLAFVLPIVFLLAGVAVAASWTKPADGAWQCFASDRFPSPEAAASWEKAKALTDGMNQVAKSAAAGTVVSVPIPNITGQSTGVVCVKY